MPNTTMIQLSALLLFSIFFTPALAFGAGEVPDGNQWDGYVWRHGDIEKILAMLPVSFLTRYAFTEMQIRQVYFGNWLRDYSQVLDITCLKKAHEQILRGVVSVLAFMEFKLATGEFDVTRERLGVYKHVEHIDNPKGYAEDEPDKDASKLDSRLRGPVQEEELQVDPYSGMKNYIAKSGQGWDTSTDYIRRQLTKCVQLGREGNDQSMQEAFILLGAAMHTLEDFSAHSNFTELCLHEMGERDIFAMVGDRSWIDSPNGDRAVAPLVTGTFGALDILQSFLGEADDKVAILNQGESDSAIGDLDSLTNKLTPGGMAFNEIFTAIRNTVGLLSKIPGTSSKSGLLGLLEQIAGTVKDAEENPEKFDPSDDSEPMPDLWETIKPAFELHDEVQKWLMENNDLFKFQPFSGWAEDISSWIDAMVYKFIALLIEPAIQEVRNAVKAGKDAAFDASASSIYPDNSTDTDPSHSEIAKDHYTNLLNQPAGLVATVTTNWSVQQIVQCWDQPSKDADAAIDEILMILHHPAFVEDKLDVQKYMFSAVETWWHAHSEAEKTDLRIKLGKQSVQEHNDNHDHTTTAKSFQVRKDLRYAFNFPGSRPDLVARPKKTDPLSEMKELVEKVGKGLEAAGKAVTEGAVKVVDFANDTADDISRGFDSAVDTVGDGLGKVGQGFVSVADDVGEGLNNFGRGTVEVVGTVGDGLKKAADVTVHEVTEITDKVTDTIADGAKSAWGTVSGWFD